MAQARERWLIDGYELTDGVVMDVEYRAGLYTTAPLVGENATVPARSGEVWRRKRRGAVAFGVNIWLGTTADRQDLDLLYDDIIQAIGDGSRLPVWTRYLADGTVRETQAEVVGVLSPQPVGQKALRLAIEAKAPSGIWESTVDASDETAGNPGTGNVLVLTSFGRGITAPLERLTYSIRGPATNPEVVDVTAGIVGESFIYNGTIPAGGTLTINSDTWGVNGDTFAPDRQAFLHTGPRFLTVRVPRPRNYCRLRFNYTNGGPNTRLTVTGKQAFAV